MPIRRSTLVLGACLAGILVSFVLASPRSAGPDEPSHMVASAALVRGDRTGVPYEFDPGLRVFEVPAMVGDPNPGCWALQPQMPVGCATFTGDSTILVDSLTTSANYPPWTYVLPGLASFVPLPTAYAYLARLSMAAVPLALLLGVLLRVRSANRGTGAAVLLGLTPIAWFSMSIVNPSAVAIAGGLALWTALLVKAASDRQPDVLLLAGWTATLLARRDGPIWVLLIVTTICLTMSIRPSALLRRQAVPVRWLFLLIALLPVATTLVTGLRDVNLLISLSPIGLVALDWGMGVWDRTADSTSRRRQLVVWATAGVLGLIAAIRLSPGGFDQTVWLLVVSDTGDHLRQLVGILGWLDTPVPDLGVFLFWIGLGALAALAFLEDSRVVIGAAVALAALVVTAWVLEVGQGSSYGQYWQGRYSMPFFIGIPLLLASRRATGDDAGDQRFESAAGQVLDRLAWPIGIIACLVMNIGFIGALHRWGVGVGGSWAPQRWNTWGAPVHPLVLIIVHALVTTGLLLVVVHPALFDRREP